ncbi:hypothetical protein DICPUDRAFT_153794 [Dictyostelium purpureum]|uniref:Uncharacterized protein n=1 Tax=Dictyostelium purpureum TaxID=5786 RepID=F0ZPR9_DICPU|nr:uncharacterized protein DICPUDRAFT_153794 [Dictyostelium purpureum]EGC34057.1 hypothetical protein DICPUDRAFT_153794 [Dictyostelium purpureum]|eukprot:XP_003289421.1 hypothetical protein DICPUDRAFT_153794 [Dictyostelium purpureum]
MVITSSSSPPSTEGLKSLTQNSTPCSQSPPQAQNSKATSLMDEGHSSSNGYSNNGFSRENSLPFLMDLAIEDSIIKEDDEEENDKSRAEEILNSKSEILINESYNNNCNINNTNEDNTKEKSYIPKSFKKVTYSDNPIVVNNVIFDNNNNNNNHNNNNDNNKPEEIEVSPIIHSSKNNRNVIDEDDEPSIVVSEDIGPVSSSATMNSFEVNPSLACGESLATELSELFSHFRRYKQSFQSKKEEELYKYQEIVNRLFEKDYIISKINNKEGDLCATYPPDLIVIEHEKQQIAQHARKAKAHSSRTFS